MYYSINEEKVKGLKDGTYFDYTSGGLKDFIVVDRQKRYNARSTLTKSAPNLGDFEMIKCIDPSEIKFISVEDNPEYFV